MTAAWEFNKVDPSSVQIDLTQQDQFNNDDVPLSEALVREAIQNSSDAEPDSPQAPVKVRLAIKELNAAEAKTLNERIAPLAPHFDECGLDRASLEEGGVRVLSIEDFNTTGLTGAFDALDEDNFENFWRKIGKSEKRKGKLGRWGLGKLVFPSSSRASLFFGLTMRFGDSGPAALGQVVLSNHRIGDNFHPAHGFWFAGRSDNILKLQMPTTDQGDLEFLRTISDIKRTTEPGFSVVVPYLISSVTEQSLIEGVISNYYFPILSGRLVVEVGDKLIDSDTFLEVAEQFGGTSHRTPFDFILEISERLAKSAPFAATQPATTTRVLDQILPEQDLIEMKEKFAKGELIHFRVPVELSPKHGSTTTGNFDIFLQALGEGQSPYSLFARGAITLPRERHFSGIARAAMIAHDKELTGLLGDAENPAHTAWNQNAKLLNKRWDNGKAVLAAVRHSAQELYSLIAEQSEIEDEDALIDFFSIIEKVEKSTGKKRKTPKKKVEIEPRKPGIRITPKEGGFEIKGGPAASDWNYPRVLRVKMAYDMIGANPFKKYSRFDFEIGKDKAIKIETEDADHEVLAPNIIKIIAKNEAFRLNVTGFDKKRDLLVDARAV